MILSTKPIEPDSELFNAAQKFMDAGREYREWLKRNAPDRLAACIWINDEDGGVVMFAEDEQYGQAIISAVNKVEDENKNTSLSKETIDPLELEPALEDTVKCKRCLDTREVVRAGLKLRCPDCG